ncbi:DUF3017 domain-containing protein [Actinotalea sp. C106]|uniref:DUF3017 domain-containing protein n=1 Tax=Actinotalea sp. C106 TaxID=2908644 RepID=UPI0020290238|nr:DUF3017 domain-containing protein [Actinotalea sp. C106]
MSEPQAEAHERHRAPALWLVATAIALACVATEVVDAQVGVVVIIGTLVAAAVARLVGRGRHPEGVAVRSTWQDAVTLGGLAVAMGVLVLAPGV